jgi:hypothetical protein
MTEGLEEEELSAPAGTVFARAEIYRDRVGTACRGPNLNTKASEMDTESFGALLCINFIYFAAV